MGKVIQLQGDQRQKILEILIEEGIEKETIKYVSHLDLTFRSSADFCSSCSQDARFLNESTILSSPLSPATPSPVFKPNLPLFPQPSLNLFRPFPPRQLWIKPYLIRPSHTLSLHSSTHCTAFAFLFSSQVSFPSQFACLYSHKMLFVYLKIDFLFLLIGDGAAGRERRRTGG